MIKGLVITPPAIGRISIGKIITNREGKRLPQKDDEFTITTQVQGVDGWKLHPFDAALRNENNQNSASTNVGATAAQTKLRSIPVKVLFNEPDLNLRADYCLFDRKTGRAECVGNGQTCKRLTSTGVETLQCPSPDQCTYNIGNSCKPYGRLNVLIDAQQGTDEGRYGDELGSFVFRTTGYNSIRTLAARLSYFAAVSGGHLASMPLELKLRGKSTAQSHRSAIFYADLVVRTGLSLKEAVALAGEDAQQKLEAGMDQQALDAAARAGLANGMFEETPEETLTVVEEFYPESGFEELRVDAIQDEAHLPAGSNTRRPTATKINLAQKLQDKMHLSAAIEPSQPRV